MDTTPGNFTKVDPRLESPGATFQDLVNEVHARGMKIVLDVVLNHSAVSVSRENPNSNTIPIPWLLGAG